MSIISGAELDQYLADQSVLIKQWQHAEMLKLSPASSGEDVFSYMLKYESAGRPGELLRLHRSLFPTKTRKAGQAFWRWVAMTWSAFDAIPHSQYEQAFHRWGDYWSADFTRDTEYGANRAFYDGLPDTGITIYRGQDEYDEAGLSWTTDMKVAQGFARGHRGLVKAKPTVLESVVAKKDIALAFVERNESEIVLFSPASAEIVAYHALEI
jgi:hypothetical protein